jgi:hypothetical protein
MEVVRYPNEMVNHIDELKASILEHCNRRAHPGRGEGQAGSRTPHLRR